MKAVFRTNAAVLASVLSTVVAAQPAPTHCRTVTGTVETRATTEGCTSLLGCFEGRLVTNSPLRGQTFFTVESIVQNPDGTLSYTGTLILTVANRATVTFLSEGTLDPVTGQFVETDTATFSGGTATLTFTGTAAPGLTGFSGTAAGELCGSSPRRN